MAGEVVEDSAAEVVEEEPAKTSTRKASTKKAGSRKKVEVSAEAVADRTLPRGKRTLLKKVSNSDGRTGPT